ncbi:MAG: SEL1-like repeat protein [Verrucomicrobiota bacterium]
MCLLLRIVAGLATVGLWLSASAADPADAIRALTPLRPRKAAMSRRNLPWGVMFYSGDGVPRHWSEAAKWMQRAAEQGNAVAQSDLEFSISTARITGRI